MKVNDATTGPMPLSFVPRPDGSTKEIIFLQTQHMDRCIGMVEGEDPACFEESFGHVKYPVVVYIVWLRAVTIGIKTSSSIKSIN